MNTIQILGALELGLIYGLVAIGVYLTFRILDFPDLTVDGSFPLGAAVSAALLLKGAHPLLATGMAVLAGGLAGLITGFLHVRFKILGLLAGILTMTALYSINLRIMGSPNLALLNEVTLFDNRHIIGCMAWICALIGGGTVYFLSTHAGLGLRATGINPKVSKAYGVQVGGMVLLGLAISNGITALAGALFAQSQGFADISMGAGTVIVGLASVIIGETILNTRRLSLAILSCLIGSIVYRLAIVPR